MLFEQKHACVSDRRTTDAVAKCSQEVDHLKMSVTLLIPTLVVFKSFESAEGEARPGFKTPFIAVG